ncbi:diphthine--ammonia ligase isoform X3 [Macaca fascicularis]|uniref:diphthine--ammonia ligase isoform X3 n=1 Tax=Macaca fascicularis TaxID=9541 RepID=UPI0032B047A8
MRVAALISGGKDSCYNMMQCIAAGHQIVALANLRPAENQVGSDELDSYMYQTVGHHAIDLYAEAMALPLYRRTIRGRSLDTRQVYTKCEGDEVEDLYELLKLVKEKEEVEGISVGAILSDYQRIRVENVCKRLNLQPLAYLWQRNQEDLLREMISSNIQAMIIKVAALGITGHRLNPGCGGCSKSRSHHCTPAWTKERDSVTKKKKKKREIILGPLMCALRVARQNGEKEFSQLRKKLFPEKQDTRREKYKRL